MESEILVNTIMIIIGLAITGIAGGIIGYFKTKSLCIQNISNNLEVLSKRSFRIEKALIILARMIDEQTNKAHPEVDIDLDGLIKEMLKSNNE